jgi:hypothetical protein
MELYLNMLGADPELFFMKDGHPQSAEGLVGGTKQEPRPIPGLSAGFAVQEDNVACEFNIPPAANAEAFNRNINSVLKYIAKVAKKNGCELTFNPCLDFPVEQVTTPHALTMGCDPDYSVWTMAMNPRPVPPKLMRTAAGHVHVSWTGIVNKETQTLVGKAMDVYNGLPHIVSTEPNKRRELYGKAGCIRPKPWGIEYRTLDCDWVRDFRLRKQVFRNTEALFFQIRNNNRFAQEINSWGEEIQHAINNHDKDMALKIMGVFQVDQYPMVK